jgi:ADP-ribose pyrophosphatase YjhB (NUDIX family)
MTVANVKIARDPEAPESSFLAIVRFDGEEHATQGDTVDEARFMAADLLRTLDVPEETTVRFVVRDEAPLSELPRSFGSVVRKGLKT